MTPFSQSLAISQRHREKHIQAFDNFLSKCTSAQNCAHLLFGQSSRECREENFSTHLPTNLQVYSTGTHQRYLREFSFSQEVAKGFLPENIFYLLAMKASTCPHLWGQLIRGSFQSRSSPTVLGAKVGMNYSCILAYLSIRHSDYPTTRQRLFLARHVTT